MKQLLDEKHNAHAAYVSNPSSRFLKGTWQEARARVQRTLRETENQRWMKKAEQIRMFADANDQQNFYYSLNQIYGIVPVRTADGASLLTSGDDILKRWEEHYKQLLNTYNRCDPSVLDQIPALWWRRSWQRRHCSGRSWQRYHPWNATNPLDWTISQVNYLSEAEPTYIDDSLFDMSYMGKRHYTPAMEGQLDNTHLQGERRSSLIL